MLIWRLGGKNPMESYEYATLYQFETEYWWYKTLHGVLRDQLAALDLPAAPRILDAGCGTGGNLISLQTNITTDTYGFDYSPHAAAFWEQRGISRACLGSINEIPYASESFDAAMSIDVLESDGVDEAAACSELCRVVKHGGYVLFTVPAYMWMLTEEHHRAVHASRRYVRKSAISLIDDLPVKLIRATYVFAMIFPAVAAYRLLLKLRPPSGDTPRSELKPMSPLINSALTGYNGIERRLLRHANMPFGSSILVMAQKR
jgi:SAM-dependent methyltransferase